MPDASPPATKLLAAAPKTRRVKSGPEAATPRAKVATSPAAAKAAPPAKAAATVRKSGNTLRLKDLTERVETLTGGKKKAVRQAVEAVLTVLGHALMAGDDLNLPPLGRARVSRQRDREDGEILMIRLKRHADDPAKPDKAAGRKAAKEALAAGSEDG